MAAVSVCKYQKAERKDKKLSMVKWWRSVGKNYCVLVGWQTQQSEKGKSRGNGSVSTAVSENGRGDCKSWGRRIRSTESISVFNSNCVSL